MNLLCTTELGANMDFKMDRGGMPVSDSRGSEWESGITLIIKMVFWPLKQNVVRLQEKCDMLKCKRPEVTV